MTRQNTNQFKRNYSPEVEISPRHRIVGPDVMSPRRSRSWSRPIMQDDECILLDSRRYINEYL